MDPHESPDVLGRRIGCAIVAPSQRDVSLIAALAALPGPAEVVITGNPNFSDETVLSYELGYRAQINSRLSVDLAMFLNSYRGLQTIEPLPPFSDPNSSPPLLLIPNTFANKMSRHDRRHRGVRQLENYRSLDAQPGLFIFENASAYRPHQHGYNQLRRTLRAQAPATRRNSGPTWNSRTVLDGIRASTLSVPFRRSSSLPTRAWTHS